MYSGQHPVYQCDWSQQTGRICCQVLLNLYCHPPVLEQENIFSHFWGRKKLPVMKGVMSMISGKSTLVVIFLWRRLECSNLLRWNEATTGSFCRVSCLVDSWCRSQWEHLILDMLPRCSAWVNLWRQSSRLMESVMAGRSREMSQNGSMVVETPWHTCTKIIDYLWMTPRKNLFELSLF